MIITGIRRCFSSISCLYTGKAMEPRRLIEVMALAEQMKNQTRHSWTSGGRHESVAEHSWRLGVLAYFVKDEFPEADMERVMLMCMFHDIGEAFTGDVPAFEKDERHEKEEERQVRKWIGELPEPYRDELWELFEEMKAKRTLEAKIYKALDRLEALIQHNEADISTWLPLEYDLQLTYGEKDVSFSSYLKELRRQVNLDSIEKMKSEFKKSEKEPSA